MQFHHTNHPPTVARARTHARRSCSARREYWARPHAGHRVDSSAGLRPRRPPRRSSPALRHQLRRHAVAVVPLLGADMPARVGGEEEHGRRLRVGHGGTARVRHRHTTASNTEHGWLQKSAPMWPITLDGTVSRSSNGSRLRSLSIDRWPGGSGVNGPAASPARRTAMATRGRARQSPAPMAGRPPARTCSPQHSLSSV